MPWMWLDVCRTSHRVSFPISLFLVCNFLGGYPNRYISNAHARRYRGAYSVRVYELAHGPTSRSATFRLSNAIGRSRLSCVIQTSM